MCGIQTLQRELNPGHTTAVHTLSHTHTLLIPPSHLFTSQTHAFKLKFSNR